MRTNKQFGGKKMTGGKGKTHKSATASEVKEIIDTWNNGNGKIEQKDIATKLGRVPSFVCTVIKGYKAGNRRILALYNAGHSPVQVNPPAQVDTQSHRITGRVTHLTGKGKTEDVGDNNVVVVASKARKENLKKMVDKSAPRPGKHAGKIHELSDKYKNIDRKELEFLTDAKTSDEFIKSYFKHFGFENSKTVSMLNEVWKRREDILRHEYDKQHAVKLPDNNIVTSQITIDPRKSAILAHLDETVAANMSNKIAMMNQLLKEVTDLQKEIITSVSRLSEPEL
jgi:hypothetical protein